MKNTIIAWAWASAALCSAHAATYQSVVPEKSAITFKFKQMGVPMDGQFKRFNAQVRWNTEQAAQAKGQLDIDLASIDTGSSEANEEVVGKAWFNVAAHPKARFVLSQLKPIGANQYEAKGQLTIKGQTRDIATPVKLSPSGMLSGSFVMKRADFGIGEGMWAKFDVVANEITVQFNLNLK